jgi:predicted dienelactone hydrolase
LRARRPPRPRRRARAAAAIVALAAAGAALALVGEPPAGASVAHAPFAVGLRFETYVDHSRTVRLANGTSVPRALLTEVRYPALGPAGVADTRDAPAAAAAGPFPLIVFGHGFDVTPATYTALMRSWARAGFVVAAPVFPLANPRAPGGATEADLPNEPADMSFVISRVLADSGSAHSAFHGLVDRGQIAVAGQSDGGEAALAAAYDPRLRDARIRAAMILSGAEIPQLGAFAFPAHGPPLLATQGSADRINPPSLTNVFYEAAHAPKFLLTLIGASHLPPYTTEQPQLAIVERVTAAFLDYYVEGHASARRTLAAAGDVRGVATLQADP